MNSIVKICFLLSFLPFFIVNTGTSSETSIINQDTIEVEGQVAVGNTFSSKENSLNFFYIGNYSIFYDTESRNTHFVYVLIDGELISSRYGQNSFTIEIQDHEEYEKKILKKFRENIWLYGKLNR